MSEERMEKFTEEVIIDIEGDEKDEKDEKDDVKSEDETDEEYEYKINNSVVLYNYTKGGMSVLAYGYKKCPNPKNIEFTGSDITVPIYGWKMQHSRRNIDKNKNRDKELKLCILGEGSHRVNHEYEDQTYVIDILIEGEEFFQSEDNSVFKACKITLSTNEKILPPGIFGLSLIHI